MSFDPNDPDASFIREALPAFISEAHEQIVGIEQLLLKLEEDPQDRELLNALFRCAHTVKGSAGIFGLSKVVEFTHHVETLLDKMREGEIALDATLNTLLLQCNDQILHLIETAADDSADTSDHVENRADLVIRLHAAMGETGGHAATATKAAAPAEASAPSGPQRWLISVRFGLECFRNGMDPLGIIRYLGTLGQITAISCDRNAIPALDAVDPEACHLSLELVLETEANRETIEDAFSFVKDDCELRLVAPSAPLDHYADLLEAMPDRPMLGDILVNIGAISRDQLEAGLRTQQNAVQAGGAAPKLGDVLQQQAGVAPEVVAAALQKQSKRDSAPGTAGGGDDNRYIRVQADRLDAVINLLGELVIAGAGAELMARETQQSAVIEASQQMGRLIEEIRNGTLQLRMVPIGETFSRFRRVVRDTAAELEKEVTLEIVGGESEMDKSVVEKIADPLMHLVRNSLDHGLEKPADRIAAGKPGTGRLILSARHETGSVLIRIEDDGRGINRERVLQRAWDRGLVEQGVVPSDDEINMLIFEAGFSTAEKVTNLSGRGVGMDVVRRNIEALRGSLRLNNNPGRGLQVDIRLPLTLAIIDGFMVGVGNSRFVLPLESMVEVIEAADLNDTVDNHGRHCLELRGQLLPVVRLRSLYAVESNPPDRLSVVVVKSPRGNYGIEVEILYGQQQTVIKPLGRLFKTLRGISGSSILGSGDVALILDVAALGELVTPDSTSGTRTSPSARARATH